MARDGDTQPKAAAAEAPFAKLARTDSGKLTSEQLNERTEMAYQLNTLQQSFAAKDFGPKTSSFLKSLVDFEYQKTYGVDTIPDLAFIAAVASALNEERLKYMDRNAKIGFGVGAAGGIAIAPLIAINTHMQEPLLIFTAAVAALVIGSLVSYASHKITSRYCDTALNNELFNLSSALNYAPTVTELPEKPELTPKDKEDVKNKWRDRVKKETGINIPGPSR